MCTELCVLLAAGSGGRVDGCLRVLLCIHTFFCVDCGSKCGQVCMCTELCVLIGACMDSGRRVDRCLGVLLFLAEYIMIR